MGRRVFWADRGNSNYVEDPENPIYAIAHGQPNGDWLGAPSHLLVGQAVGWTGINFGILRAKTQFPTLNIPLTETVLSASIFAVFDQIGAAPQVELNIVSGVGLGPDIIDPPDFGILLPQVIPYSSIIIPAGGLPDMLERELVLNAGGIAEILQNDWTRFGYRDTEDISAIPPGSTHAYCGIHHGFYDGFAGVFNIFIATTGLNTLNFSGILQEAGATYGLFQKLVIQTNGLIDGSQFDVRFAYGTTPPGMGPWVPDAYTPWKLAQPLNQLFSETVGGLPFGHYYYSLEARWPDVDMGTNTRILAPLEIDLLPPPAPPDIGNAIKKKLFATGAI